MGVYCPNAYSEVSYMVQSINKCLLLLGMGVAVGMLLSFPGFAQNSFAISNNTPGFIRKAVDQGPVDPTTVIFDNGLAQTAQ